jgi:hypothetical protein
MHCFNFWDCRLLFDGDWPVKLFNYNNWKNLIENYMNPSNLKEKYLVKMLINFTISFLNFLTLNLQPSTLIT